jgi:hypothetical protein
MYQACAVSSDQAQFAPGGSRSSSRRDRLVSYFQNVYAKMGVCGRVSFAVLSVGAVVASVFVALAAVEAQQGSTGVGLLQGTSTTRDQQGKVGANEGKKKN